MSFIDKMKDLFGRIGIEDGEIVFDLNRDDQTNDQGEVVFIEGEGIVDPIAGLHADDRCQSPD